MNKKTWKLVKIIVKTFKPTNDLDQILKNGSPEQ